MTVKSLRTHHDPISQDVLAELVTRGMIRSDQLRLLKGRTAKTEVLLFVVGSAESQLESVKRVDSLIERLIKHHNSHKFTGRLPVTIEDPSALDLELKKTGSEIKDKCKKNRQEFAARINKLITRLSPEDKELVEALIKSSEKIQDIATTIKDNGINLKDKALMKVHEELALAKTFLQDTWSRASKFLKEIVDSSILSAVTDKASNFDPYLLNRKSPATKSPTPEISNLPVLAPVAITAFALDKSIPSQYVDDINKALTEFADQWKVSHKGETAEQAEVRREACEKKFADEVRNITNGAILIDTNMNHLTEADIHSIRDKAVRMKETIFKLQNEEPSIRDLYVIVEALRYGGEDAVFKLREMAKSKK